jgi:hypothetical protein
MALRRVCSAVLCAGGAGAGSFVRALRDLRQLGIATHLGGTRSGNEFAGLAAATRSGVALRTVPAQVFFREAVDERSTKSRSDGNKVSPIPTPYQPSPPVFKY